MKSNHTPGPWELDQVWMLIKGPQGQEVCAVHSGQGDDERVDRNVAYANARLIASAPELLEAMKQAYVALEKSVHFQSDLPFWRKGGDGYSAMLDAHSAILKAQN